MQFGVLGPVEVRDGDSSVPIGGGKERALLACLLLNAGEAVSSDRLIDELWGERAPPTAPKALQVYVSKLRKALGPDRIVTSPAGYRLDVEPGELDLDRFERLRGGGVGALAAGDPRKAAELIEAALALWRGPPLADLAFEPFAQSEAARLEELRLAALEERVEAHLALGRHRELVPELERLVEQQPLRERPRAQLMLALYRSGRQAEALDTYREGRRVLVDELGIEPGPELRALERKILEHDPALDVPASVLSPPPEQEGAGTEERKPASAVVAEFDAGSEVESDPERLRELLERVQAEATDEIEVAGGRIESRVGSTLFSTFGAASAQEDHTERALHAALAVRSRMSARFGAAVSLGIGVESGTVLSGPGAEAAVVGAPVTSAARLAADAGSGEILVGRHAARAVRGGFELRPRGSAQLLVRAVPWSRPPGAPGLGRTFVGRESELTFLRATLDRVSARGRPQLVTVVGEPGVGKTSVLRELRKELGETGVAWYAGACPAYGRAITYRPLAAILRKRLGLRGDDSPEALRAAVEGREILGLVLGLDPALGLHPWEAREQLHDALVGFLEELSADGPVVVVVEDLHWAEEALLELLERAVHQVRGPLLLLVTARPELLSRAPAWGGSRGDSSRLWLEPLSHADVARMLERLAGAVPDELRELLIDSAGGNPFFVEEILHSLVDRGWNPADPPTQLDPPESVQAVIAARMDLLPRPQKTALQAASVMGRSFWEGAVRELVELPGDGLRLLEDREFIERRAESTLEGEREYGFRHALTREVAYRSLPLTARARFHADFADWLPERDEYASLLADHYSEAAADPRRLPAVRRAAVRWLRRAGELAVGRYELEDADALFRQAAGLEDDREARTELWRAAADACLHRFDLDGFRRAMEEAIAATTDEATAARLHAELALEGAQPYMWRAPPSTEEVEEWIERALGPSCDEATRARGLVASAFVRPEKGRAAAEEGTLLAERLGEPQLRAEGYQARSVVATVAGDLEEARRWAARGADLAPRLADPDERSGRYYNALFAYLRTGHIADGRRFAREHDAIAARLTPHHEVHAVGAHLLVETVACRFDEAAALAHRALAASEANEDTPCQFNWRSLLMAALACAQLGDEAEAERLESEAKRFEVIGGPRAREPALLRLALLREDLTSVERLLAANPGAGPWDVDYPAARLDGLATLGDRKRVEREAAAALALGGYVEPFALRALGLVREDTPLLERAIERFEQLGLGWRAEETRQLVQRKGGGTAAPPPRRSRAGRLSS
jgi:DNA-binding SARP family transcriptional activator